MPWLPAMALLGLSLVGSAWLNLRPKAEGPVAAVFPPWWSAGDSFAAAAASGAPIVRLGTPASIVVVAGANPSIHRRLYEAGALLVIDPVALGGCFGVGKT